MISKKMRFLFVIGYNCPFPGAGWWRVYNLAKNFKEKGHECYILSCVTPNTLNSSKVLQKGIVRIYNVIPYLWINNPIVFLLNNILASIASVPFFLLLRPTSVIISIPPPDQLLSTYFLSKIFRSKLIIDYRDEFEDFFINNLKKWTLFYRFIKKLFTSIYKHATVVAPVTFAVAENLHRRNIKNVKVVLDGVDTEIFHPFNKNNMRSKYGIPEDSFVVIYLGNAYAPYRLDVVIKALKYLDNKNPEINYLLVLAGGGNIESVLTLAKNLQIINSVKYVGVFKNPLEIAEILSAADCGIIPYDDNPLWQKTYSTKLFEYAAIGLPIIGTAYDYSALAQVIRANEIGLIVPPVNIVALALSIETLCSDKKLRMKIRLSALHFASLHDKKLIANDLLDTIEKS
jgi:glycosyltransferase involved in cell wall biosynthesis